MKEKSQFEKNAADKQVELLSEALNGAVSAGGHWLNATGKVAIEVVTEYPFYLCKTLCMSDFAHILIIQLVQKLFFGLLYGVMVYLHLFGKELL